MREQPTQDDIEQITTVAALIAQQFAEALKPLIGEPRDYEHECYIAVYAAAVRCGCEPAVAKKHAEEAVFAMRVFFAGRG